MRIVFVGENVIMLSANARRRGWVSCADFVLDLVRAIQFLCEMWERKITLF